MLAGRPLRRRPVVLTFFTCLVIYLMGHLGPPFVTPGSADAARQKASQWAASLESDISAIYHTTSSLTDNPKIRQATMLFEGDKDHLRNMYDRSLATHLKHGERWGVPTHLLKQSLVEEGSYFNKPAWLLNLLLTEMSKPPGRRAEWIVYVHPSISFISPSAFPTVRRKMGKLTLH